jgi:hypothetical protein
LVIILQLNQLAIGMAAGIVIIRHPAFATRASFFSAMAIINRSKMPHAIVQVHRNTAGYSQVKEGQYEYECLFH